MANIICRKATNQDMPGVVALQDANLVSNLSATEQKDGFLSGAFTAGQFSEMNDDVGVFVAVESNNVGGKAVDVVVRGEAADNVGDDRAGDNIVGFICIGSVEFNTGYPLPAAMIESFSGLYFSQRRLDSYVCVIAGPVCIAKEKRGTRLFETMYNQVASILPSRVQVITTLVSKSNPRSLRAHEKVGMTVVGNFLYQGCDFVIMARLASSETTDLVSSKA
jgi:hypothetical protein